MRADGGHAAGDWVRLALGQPSRLVEDDASITDRKMGIAPFADCGISHGQDAGAIANRDNTLVDQVADSRSAG
jgi:hypothetical protein